MSTTNFAELIDFASSPLRVSYQNIRKKCATYPTYPICLMEYIENDIHENCIEVRLDKEHVSLSFYFDEENNYNSSFLLFDKEEHVEPLINYLIDNYDYSFILGRWTLSGCYLRISKQENGIFLMFYFS